MLQDERDAITKELTPPFEIANEGALTTPFVLCSPHSGRVYPSCFLERSKRSPAILRKSEDCFVDHLFAKAATMLDAPLICARFPRAYLDVNREPYELDPKLFDEPLPDFANQHTTRVIGGLGTIARIVADGEEIYDAPLPLDVAFERIERLYKPFHSALNDLLAARQSRFGYAILIDCHSMPSTSMLANPDTRPDIVLGDRFGTSCSPALTRSIKSQLEAAGHTVQTNRPYAGGFITEHYGRPTMGCHAIQIEINRGLYMDEKRLKPTMGLTRLSRDLEDLAQALIRDLAEIAPRQLAAE